MTFEQFERAMELKRRIERLKNLLTIFKEHEINDSPSGMTGFDITRITGGGYKAIHVIENSELEFFIDSIESKINVLEHEFNRL